MKTILISNRKGGVGKTTTSLNLATQLASRGYRVLLMDLDTQSHLQFGLGFRKKFKKGMHQALMENSLVGIIQKTLFDNLEFAPADINFDISSLNLEPKSLKKIFKNSEIIEKYDFCVIDTPPVSDMILNSAMVASDYVIVPMQTEYLGYIGAIQFLKLFYKTASTLNANFKLLGVLPTLFNKSIKEHQEIIDMLKDKLGEKRVFTPIRKDFKLSESFRNGKPIFYYDKRSRGNKDYQELVQSVLERI